MPLFSSMQLKMLGFERHLSNEACTVKHTNIRRLAARIADRCLVQLTETRVEQSFNERLFAEVFDYLTLLRHGANAYHLLPKGGVVIGRKADYDDFSLGFFDAGAHLRLVHAELKKYGTRLDRKQTSGRHRGKTPVEQAFAAGLRSPTIQWIIVSNFDEMRLYHRRSMQDYQRVTLADVVSNTDLRRAYVTFGQPVLLGERGRPSPLLRMLDGGSPMLFTPEAGTFRLVHEARCLIDGEASLPEMDDAFRLALKAPAVADWPWGVPKSADPSYEDDRLLVEDDIYARPRARLEYSRNGVVRLQERLETQDPSGGGKKILVAAQTIAERMAMFIATAGRMLQPFSGARVFRWSILDGTEVVVTNPPEAGLHHGPAEITTKEYGLNTIFDPSSRTHLAPSLTKALRDLLFPWHHIRHRGQIARLSWTDALSESALARVGL